MGRSVEIWTWDCGRRMVDMDGPPNYLLPILETVLDGGLRRQFEKFPPDVVERLLPRLQTHPQTRRLVEVGLEEHARPAA